MHALPLSPEDPASYVEAMWQRLLLTHQQMTPPPAPVATNPYHEGSLIFVMTTPPERSHKLAPRWKGPFYIKRIPNPYQVTYEDGLVWRTVHINYAKPAKTPVDGFPAPLTTPEPSLPPLGYLPRSLQRPRTRQSPPLPQSAAPTTGPNQPASPPAAMPPSSRPATRSTANENSAPHAERQPLAAPGGTNRNSGMGQPLRCSARLYPQALHVKSQSQTAPAQSHATLKMARTYPLSLSYKTCLGHQEDPFNFSSLYLEDLHNGQKTYLENIEQLINAIPKSTDPASRFALRAHVTHPGHQRVRYSLRAALWWLLPPEGDFRRAPNGLHYFLACQGTACGPCEGVILPCLITTVVSTGFMIQPHPRLVAWNRQTQCLAVKQVLISVTQCPGIFLTPFPVLLVVTILVHLVVTHPVLLVVTHPVLLAVTHPVLPVVTFLVTMSPVLLIRRIPVLPALVTLCILIPNVVLRVKTKKTRCPPPPRAAH